MPEQPTGDQIECARSFLEEDLLGDFPFKAPSDRAAALSVLLLPFVREMIAGPVPIIAIEKPTIGTGASLLADLLTAPAVGAPVPPMNAPRNEEEMRKKLLISAAGKPNKHLVRQHYRQAQFRIVGGCGDLHALRRSAPWEIRERPRTCALWVAANREQPCV